MIQATGKQCHEVAANNTHTERVTAQRHPTPLPSRHARIINGELIQQGKTMHTWQTLVAIISGDTRLLNSTRTRSRSWCRLQKQAIIAAASPSMKNEPGTQKHTIRSFAGRNDGEPGTVF